MHRSNNRGAAFLLTIYLSALAILLLGGASLQRTNTELRAAQISRDVHQRFWLAEGAMDYALAHVRNNEPVVTTLGKTHATILDGVEYRVPAPAGQQARFTVETTAAAILSPDRQRLTRRIVAKGRESTSRPFSELSVVYTQEGPLEGLWARNFVIAGGGANFPETFLRGSMRSNIGALTSTVDVAARKLKLDGLGMGRDMDLDGAVDYDDVIRQVSSELRSVKEGYKLLNGLTLGKAGDDDTASTYVSGPAEQQIPHVEGNVSVGMVTSIPMPHVDVATADIPLLSMVHPALRAALAPAYCSGNLDVPETDLDIREPFATLDSSGRLIMDLDPAPNRMTLCVNSVTPATGQLWIDTMLNNPPAITFRQPTTIYVTGSKHMDVSSLTVPIPGLGTLPAALMPLVGIQNVWDVSVGAKFSAVDARGRTIANGMRIITTNPRPAVPILGVPAGAPIGVVWVKPGNFSGSVYAPDSLVVMRARELGGRDPSDRIDLQSMVGTDVIIELEADAAQVGKVDGSTVPQNTTSVLSWTAER
jgi:hypothetical protein